ncbi:MAG: DUF5996 family protein [Gammaproteobacteria bacterium]|nr:DUF5996 family protein [Gammaproteobacteria bacterium]
MAQVRFPQLLETDTADTRSALHDYARILGNYLKVCRPKRKHWWHASLRPSLSGLTTGVVHADIDFELELDLRQSNIHGRTSHGANLEAALHGQPAAEVARLAEDFLLANGLSKNLVPENAIGDDEVARVTYSAEHARSLHLTLNSVSAAMAEFRAGIPEETSPIQLWPHHFDLSMLWLPGEKIAGQDPRNEEYSDKQMNFGFTFGDEGIPEPYFYVTAYPFPDGFPSLRLPAGASWHTQGFNAAVLRYRLLIESSDPDAYLLDLWNSLLSAGREQMLANSDRGQRQ